MKIAICFSGQIRTGDVVAPNILRYIGKELLPHCDFFVHTWDCESKGTGYANRLGVNSLTPDIHESSIITEQAKISAIYDAYRPRKIEVEEYHLQPTKNLWGGRRLNPLTGKYNISMWESIQKANALKIQYANQNQIKYDITVRIRPDIVFSHTKSLLQDMKLLTHSRMFVFGDHYNIWPGYQMTRLEDIFWIGPTNVMDEICNFSDYITNTTVASQIDDPKDPNYKDWQWYSAAWITNQLGIEFRALADNAMRIYYSIDTDKNIDPMNPNFGSPPGKV